MKKDEGLRYNEGKERLDLITPEITKAIGDILTLGASKYAERNWEKGMKWTSVLASLKRHLTKFEFGEDFDKESGQLHINHILTNAAFLSTYYKTHPEFDDRPTRFFNKKIALDLDGVLVDFDTEIEARFKLNKTPTSWYYTYKFNSELWKEVLKDQDFWVNMKPYFDGSELLFEPVCYVTHRSIPTEWCEQWVEKNNYPCVPVYVVDGSKVEVLKQLVDEGKVDIFVEDRYDNFIELNNNGICTFLLDRPWNRRYDVGHKRIYNLNDLVKRY